MPTWNENFLRDIQRMIVNRNTAEFERDGRTRDYWQRQLDRVQSKSYLVEAERRLKEASARREASAHTASPQSH